MSDIAVKAENVGKLYRLGEVGTGTITHDLNRWWARVRGKEDPFAKIGEANDRTKKGDSDYVWALKDVDFEIKKGEAVGIIGRNGAGKSTLLKLLSKVTKPSTGSIKVNGRIASLLEVGTGFHPEMTGRENIYLNGVILGMTKKEITRKFDEIVDFSGVERYIDTPVKRYSSGMYVRLAFAVAAHLESEILIVDEVLAVGDAEFQKKCLGKMNDVSKGEGRTVLFVSHNMNAIQALCNTCVYMANGILKEKNSTNSIIALYLTNHAQKHFMSSDFSKENPFLKQADLYTSNQLINGSIKFKLQICSTKAARVSIDFRVNTSTGIPVAFSSIGALNYEDMFDIKPGINDVEVDMNVDGLAIGEYNVSIDITIPNIVILDRCEDCLGFDVIKNNKLSRQLEQKWNYGYFTLPVKINSNVK